jgi:NitT/TauT family transport system substrate-binding protein
MSRHRRIRVLLAALTAVLVAATLQACSSGSKNVADPGASSSGEKVKVKLLVLPQTATAPVYLAQQRGLFAKQGLDVQITQAASGSAIMAALQSGGADIGLANYVTVFSGMSHGLRMKFIANSLRGDPDTAGVFVKKGSPITSMADLKGKKIGVPNTGSVSDLMTDQRISESGLTPKDVTYVTVPMPNALSALTNGQVDGSFLTGTQFAQAKLAGDPLIVDAWTNTSAHFPVVGYAVQTSWLSGHGAVATKFRAALDEAGQIAQADPNAVRQILPSYMHLTPAQAKTIAINSDWSADIAPAQMQQVSDLMVKFGFIPKAIAPSDVLAG